MAPIAPDRDECSLVNHCALVAFIGLAHPDAGLSTPPPIPKSIRAESEPEMHLQGQCAGGRGNAETARRVGSVGGIFPPTMSSMVAVTGFGREEDRPGSSMFMD